MTLNTTKGSSMLRKIASLSVALVVAGGVMVAAPAEAATKISNGVACTKSGSTTKTSLGTYKCAKNPLVSSTKLTWLSIDCLTAANDAVKAQKAAVTTSANFKAQLPIIELGITTETANRAEIQAKLDEANLRLTAAQGKLAAAKTDADKKLLNTAVTSWTSATRAYASKIRSIEQTIKKLEAAKLVAVNKPAELASNVSNARESAKLICTKGF
jgi:hypothetical protein